MAYEIVLRKRKLVELYYQTHMEMVRKWNSSRFAKGLIERLRTSGVVLQMKGGDINARGTITFHYRLL